MNVCFRHFLLLCVKGDVHACAAPLYPLYTFFLSQIILLVRARVNFEEAELHAATGYVLSYRRYMTEKQKVQNWL